tara:strand:- start:67 stop:378 length:312 start_codon:yes stop_codon:yes gene_type:complete
MTIILILFLLLSLMANILLVWYIKKLFQKIYFISDNIDDLIDNLEGFSGHLEKVHSLETFYGDETLRALLEHSKSIVEYVEGYKQVYNFTDENDERDDDAEEI